MSAFILKEGNREIPLNEGITIAGREAGASDLVLDGKGISRAHCRFIVAAGEVSVEDLGSRNGVRVNGKRIDGKTRLAPGDAVQLGEMTLSVSNRQPAPAAAAALPSASPAPASRRRRPSRIPVGPIVLAVLVIAGLAVYFNRPDDNHARILELLSRVEMGLDRLEAADRDAVDPAGSDAQLGELAALEREVTGLNTTAYPAEGARQKAALARVAALKDRLTARQADRRRTAELEAVTVIADEDRRAEGLERFREQYAGTP
ncbi:MAG: FHA domain-containing protein [Planctomycetota bacterium]